MVEKLTEFIQQKKREYDRIQFQKFFARCSLPPGCYPRMKFGTGILEIICPNQDLVLQVWRNYDKYLPIDALTMQRLAIKVDGDESQPVAIETLLDVKFLREVAATHMNNINVCDDRQTLLLLERIYQADKPMSLVSLDTHRNLNFNRKLLNNLGVEAAELQDRNLLPYWLSPEEMKPGLPAGYIPKQLQDVLSELKSTSLLECHRYTGWKESSYGIWTADIEVVEIQGRWCRLMTSHDFEEISLL